MMRDRRQGAGVRGQGSVSRDGMAYIAILLLVLVLTSLGFAFLHQVSTQRAVSATRLPGMQAAYLAESAANHAMWLLLNDETFPEEDTKYYMHDMGTGRYGYKVRRHTDTTFATIATVGALGESVAQQSYVLYIPPGDESETNNMAVWSAAAVPEYSLWDGSIFGTTKSGVSQDLRWRIMAGASSPTRKEKIVVGIEDGGEISGEMWDGSAWSEDELTGLDYVSQTYWWSADVAYESQSGDLMLVWNGGSSSSADLRYKLWDGNAWTAPASVAAYAGAEPKQIKLAASPVSGEMALVVSDANSSDYALIWDGSTWGDADRIGSNSADDRTDIAVAYEQQSGRALFVSSDGGADAIYQIWDGSNWIVKSIVAKPGTSGKVRWITLASDPNSDQVVMGVTTFDEEIWLSVWNGSSWQNTIEATDVMLAQYSDYPGVAVAFESQSGRALATYGVTSTAVQYRTWDSSSGWSANLFGPNINAIPNSMMLAPSPTSDDIMLSVQNGNSELRCIPWDGTAWGGGHLLESATGETKNQPFVFLWDAVAAPVVSPHLLFVVVDADSLNAQDLAKQTLMESWGYQVQFISVGESQAAFDAAAVANTVAFITEDVNSGDLNTKLTAATIGVVTEEMNLSDEFGLSASIVWNSGTSLTIADNTHFITTPFALGNVAVYSSTESLAYISGTLSPDLSLLGTIPNGPALVTLDAGKATHTGGISAGRRALLPWGGSDHDINNLTAAGKTLMQRAIEWAAGAGEDSEPEEGIKVDAVTSVSTTGADLKLTHPTSGEDRLMLVGVCTRPDNYETVSYITYNGRSLSRIGTARKDDDARIEIWELVAPDTGVLGLKMEFSEAVGKGAVVSVVTFTGVDQTTPHGNFVSATGDSGGASVTLPSAVGELVFDTMSLKKHGSAAGAGQSEQWNMLEAECRGGGSTEPGSANVTMSWTHSGNEKWAIGAVSLKPAN